MTRFACMLRAVNVGGQRKLKMTELQKMCVSLGCTDVETYLQSGNVVVSSKLSPGKLGASLSERIGMEFGYRDVEVMVWTAAELSALIRANPFMARGCEPAKLHVTFLGKDVPVSAVQPIGSGGYLPDEFAPGTKAVYVHCPAGYGRTKLNNGFFERKLGVSATTRNWQTVNNLYELTNR